MSERLLEKPVGWDRPGRLPDQAVKEALEKDFGWKIEPPPYVEVPSPLPIYVTENLTRLINYLKHVLLQAYYIHDNFGKDHVERSKVFQNNSRYYPFVREHSKLRKGVLVMTIGCMEAIINSLKNTYPDKYQQLRCVFDQQLHLDQISLYDEMETEEKITYVKSLDEIVYSFLEALST
ncbi:MAG: hypothetical protein WCW27_01185 [Patescibacteria group bacterium]